MPGKRKSLWERAKGMSFRTGSLIVVAMIAVMLLVYFAVAILPFL